MLPGCWFSWPAGQALVPGHIIVRGVCDYRLITAWQRDTVMLCMVSVRCPLVPGVRWPGVRRDLLNYKHIQGSICWDTRDKNSKILSNEKDKLHNRGHHQNSGIIDYVTLFLGECQIICPGARRGEQSPDIRLANWNRNQRRQLAARQESRTGVTPKLLPPLSLSLTESDDKETLNKDIKCRKCTQTDLLILLVSQIDVKWTLSSGLGKIG